MSKHLNNFEVVEKCYFQYHQQMKETSLDETDNRLVDMYVFKVSI